MLSLQDLMLVLKEIPRYLQATRAAVLANEDVLQICRALKAVKNRLSAVQTVQVSDVPVGVFYQVVSKAQPQLSLEEQLELLECLIKLSKDGCSECLRGRMCWACFALLGGGHSAAAAATRLFV